jgi:hypothetical protein
MNKKKKYFPDFLFPRPTMLTGFGSIFNIWGNYYPSNYLKSNEEDRKAINSDWEIVEENLITAFKLLNEEIFYNGNQTQN